MVVAGAEQIPNFSVLPHSLAGSNFAPDKNLSFACRNAYVSVF